MIRAFLLALAISCTPTPATDDGCAGYCYTPTETLPKCEVRYALDYVTTVLPANGAACDVLDVWYVCRYWSRFARMSCACFDAESPPPGQVWRKVT